MNSLITNNEKYTENIQNFIYKSDEKILILKNSIISPNNTTNPYENNYSKEKKDIQTSEISLDTSDLSANLEFEANILKKKFTNPLLSWKMLEKISDFNQWPFNCLGNLIENSLKKDNNTFNIHIDIKFFKFQKEKKIENSKSQKLNFSEKEKENLLKKYFLSAKGNEKKFANEIEEKNSKENLNSKAVLIIKDDGKGISSENFNTIFSSIAKNEKKEFCFFKSGMSLKSSIIRLCKSFLVITKTENEINFGILSKNLQKKFDTDFLISPTLNFFYDKFSLTPKSNFFWQILFSLFDEIEFIFENFESFFDYLKNCAIGTHIFLYDLNEVNNFDNFFEEKKFELKFDLENFDICNTHFETQIGNTNFIEGSFKIYLKYLFLQRNEEVNIFLLGKKVDLINPYLGVYNTCRENNEVIKLKHSLKLDKETDGVFVDNLYKGILFNEKFLRKIQMESSYENCVVNSNCVNNGILLYCNNRLISRLDQMKFGEICFFLKKFEKLQKLKNKKKFGKMLNESDFNDNKEIEKDFHLDIFPISGFIELPKDTYETLNNKTVIILIVFLTFKLFIFFRNSKTSI